MKRIAYVNGRYVAHREASVSIEDRGYQFADGVYEVIAFYNRILIDGDLHIDRLLRSLKALNIAEPLAGRRALELVMKETVARNGYDHGYIYMQVTRGVASRDHVYRQNMKTSLVITVAREKKIPEKEMLHGTEIVTRPDIRWLRRDIKSIALLPNVLLKNEAASLAKREIWLTDEKGFVTEGSVSNAYIVTSDGVLVTREEAHHLLSGITRHRLLAIARKMGIAIEERPFTVREAEKASEAFISASTSHLVPVVRINDATLGKGVPGPVFKRLFEQYVRFIQQQTGHVLWKP
jgi:D-alanine transaminase